MPDMDHENDTAEIDAEREMERRAVALFFGNVYLSQGMVVCLALLLANAVAPFNPTLATAWMVGMVGVALLRILVTYRFNAAPEYEKADPKWVRIGIVSAAGAGLLWALGVVVFMWDAPLLQQFFVAFLIAGVVAGAGPTLAPIPMAFRLFSGPPITTVFLCAVVEDFVLSRTLAVTAVLFQLMMLRSAANYYSIMKAAIRLGVEQRALAKELAAARDAAMAASQAKSAFLAGVSHEIRTPLNGVLGMAELLLSPGLDEGERHDHARTILNSGRTLLTLLNDILDLSKVEAGKIDLHDGIFMPRQLIAETRALFAEAARAKGLRLDVDWEGAPDACYRGDATRLRQMLSNLVSNAIKFTAQGFVRIELTEPVRQGDRATLEFAVADSGIGIAPEKQKLLFKPFTQADSSVTRDYGGTGLGLSIVRLLAERMQGSAWLESEPGKGSRIGFRVDVGRVGEAEEAEWRRAEAAASAPATLAAPAAPADGGYVLVVDDNPTNRKLIEAMLKKRGIRHRSVENGQQAVDAVTQGERPDLILMDCQMPVLDGYAATGRIREWQRQQGIDPIPVIALTAGGMQEDRERCIAAGMDDFLLKPINLNDFFAMLDKWRGASPTELSRQPADFPG